MAINDTRYGLEFHGCIIAEGERMAILTNKRIIPFKGQLYDKLYKYGIYTSLMTTKILKQMEGPRPYRKMMIY